MGLPGKPFTKKIGTMIDDGINGRVEELEKENKRLALQVEVLSAAFANSSEREKDLMAEKSELIDVLYRANAHLGTIVGTDNKTPLPITFLKRQHKEFLEVLKKYQNPADLDEQSA